MDDSALPRPALPRAGRPAGSAPRRHALRAGSAAVLAAALVWPAAGAHAAVAPDVPPVVEAPAEEPAATASISGRVTDGSGAPLEGVVVVSYGADGRTETAADGTWTLDGLEPGLLAVRFVLVEADGQGYTAYWDGTPYGASGFTWAPELAEGEARTGLDVAFVDHRAAGTVTAAGAPVAGATVGFYRYPSDPSPVRTVTTGADGTWSAQWLRPDTYSVRVTPPAGSGLAPAWWGSTGNVYGTVFLNGATPRSYTGVDVDLAAQSRLTGRVVDEAGQPVAGLRVALWSGQVRPFAAVYATTAADGTYAFENLDAQPYTVRIDPERQWPGASSVVDAFLGGALTVGGAVWTPVGAQQDVAVADLVLRRGGTISGTVVAAPGWDGPGITVEFVGADGSVVASDGAIDDPDGPDFATPGAIPAGAYRVRAAMPGDGWWWVGGTSFDTARVIDLRAGAAVTDVELVLSDAFAGVPPVPTDALTADNSGGLAVTGPVVAGGTAVLTGLQDPGLEYVWLAPSFQGLGYGEVVDGTLRVAVPAGTAAGAYRLVVTTPGGYVRGWADVTVTAAAGSGGVPGGAVGGAAPGAAAPAATPTPAAARAAASRGGQRSGALAATGWDGAWIAGGALAVVLLGAGLVVLRRRSS